MFVCENSHILTYTIYLFANVLTRPFKYAFASVYILPREEEFLSVPFPVIYGLLKKKKWVEQNRITERYRNTYVFVTAVGVYVQYTEENGKGGGGMEKIRGQLVGMFKEIDKGRRIHTNKSQTCRVEISEYVQHSTQ